MELVRVVTKPIAQSTQTAQPLQLVLVSVALRISTLESMEVALQSTRSAKHSTLPMVTASLVIKVTYSAALFALKTRTTLTLMAIALPGLQEFALLAPQELS